MSTTDERGPVEEAAEKAAEKAKDGITRINPAGLASLASDTGVGFFSLAIALYAGAISYNKFHTVITGRGRATA